MNGNNNSIGVTITITTTASISVRVFVCDHTINVINTMLPLVIVILHVSDCCGLGMDHGSRAVTHLLLP